MEKETAEILRIIHSRPDLELTVLMLALQQAAADGILAEDDLPILQLR